MSGRSASAEHHSAKLGGNGEEDVNLLESMGLSRNGTISGREAFQQYNDQAVWRMLMGDDIEEGEGRIIVNDKAVDFVQTPDEVEDQTSDHVQMKGVDHAQDDVHERARDHARSHSHGHHGAMNGKNSRK